MRAIKYLIQNINPLNLLLLAIIIVIAIGVIFPLTRMNAGYILPQVKPKIIEQGEKPEEKSNSILPSDYAMIGETNLFHPERRIPIDKKADEIPKPELVLYGTMVQGGVQLAFIEDKKNPKTTPGRGNRQTVIKKGETIGGFVVSEIGTDRITLMKGDEKMTVLLANGGEKRKEQAGSQRPMQTTSPGGPTATAPSTPGSPFGPASTITAPVQRPGGRQSGASPMDQLPSAAPQTLPRGALPGPVGVLPAPVQKK
jgi:hypothetical protein